MNRPNWKRIGVGILCLLPGAVASAAQLTVVAPEFVEDGDTLTVEIWGDFSGVGLIAGGSTFLYDAELLALDAIELELPVVSDFSCPGSASCPPDSPGSAVIVWGEFLNDLIAPDDPAPTLMATLTMTAIAEGAAQLDMINNPSLTGGWFGAGFAFIETPDFIGASVAIGVDPDMDQDGVPDAVDNCLQASNPLQRDTDGDGIGNRCDPDIAIPNDCLVDFLDLMAMEQNFFAQGDLDTDLNGDGLTNMGDVGIMKQYFFGPPGASGLANACDPGD